MPAKASPLNPDNPRRRRLLPTGSTRGAPSSNSAVRTSSAASSTEPTGGPKPPAELADLQPALAAARAAWQPYANAIAAIEDKLRSRLRPAMWKANNEAMYAGFGHHHTTARRAEAATARVADVEARVADIHTNAADLKQRLEALEAEAGNLTDYARPSPAAVWLDDLDRQQLSHLDELLNAVDICIAWTSGRPVRMHELADAVATLTDAARAAPMLSLSPGQIDQSQWHGLLAPLTELLHQRGLDLQPAEAVELEGDVFGIEL